MIGNPLGVTDARDAVLPVIVLKGNDLLLKRGSTLGETLNGLSGVTTSWFGPNAGRPVIRGLDGERVRILNNLGASFDASSLSVDHNPVIDPLAIERVEVLRGPAALLYGGTAIGGVVNVIDNRIPTTPLSGLRGAFETRFGGADGERGNAALLEAGNGTVTLHIDGFHRQTDDYRVPSETSVRSPVVNSSAHSKGGAVGTSVSFAGGRGLVGASQSRYESNYGTVADADVRIDMRQTRTAAEATLRDMRGPIESVFARASRSDYKHVELEGSEIGTTFANKGHDARVEIKHAKWGAWQGVLGVQSEVFRFAALGEEAFVPQTKTRNAAAFLYEEGQFGALKIVAGTRVELSRVRSEGAVDGAPARFGDSQSRKFSFSSASFGASYRVGRESNFSAHVSRNARAPSYFELFADGAHVATAAYEVGDKDLAIERVSSFDVNFNWQRANNRFNIGVFAHRFSNYISLQRSGVDRDTEGNVNVRDCGDGRSLESSCTSEIFPEYRYRAVRAVLRGIEARTSWRLIDAPYTLDITGSVDAVRADDRTNNAPLPRIAPLRTGIGVVVGKEGFQFVANVDRTAQQSRVPDEVVLGPTRGHTLVSASALYTFVFATDRTATFFLRATNLTDTSAFNATSIDTIRRLAPLPGRSIKAGVRIDF